LDSAGSEDQVPFEGDNVAFMGLRRRRSLAGHLRQRLARSTRSNGISRGHRTVSRPSRSCVFTMRRRAVG
jgi:hypothetical protein